MMKLLITAVLIFGNLIAHADTIIKTGDVESWGYAQEKLVLITKVGKSLKSLQSYVQLMLSLRPWRLARG